jgi:hypothetical protein
MLGRNMETYQSWFINKWRPAIAWSYLFVCLFDFVGLPILYSAISENVDKLIDWTPYTLKGGGLYHMAMLTIVGVTAWGRTQEKLTLMKQALENNNSEQKVQ